MSGFAPVAKELVLGVGESQDARRRPVAHRRDRKRHVVGQTCGARPVVGKGRRQRVARGDRQPAGQRPELRQPDDAGDRRDHRRQRRLGERAVQRQVEPAELPELRRRRRHLRVGRQPRLPEATGLAVPAADLDGVGGGVPRQLRPGAGRERPRRRRQYHGRQQGRQQPVQRLGVRLLPQRQPRRGQQVRRQEAEARDEPVRRLDRAGRSSSNRTFFFGSYEGLQADDRTELHRGGAERRGDPPDPGGRAVGSGGGQSAARTQAVAPLLAGFPQGTVPDGEPAAVAGHARHRRPSRPNTASRAGSISASATTSRSMPVCSTAMARSIRPTGPSRRAASAPTQKPVNFVANHQAILGDSMVNEVKVGYNRPKYDATAFGPAGYDPTQVSLSGTVTSQSIDARGTTGIARSGLLIRATSNASTNGNLFNPRSLSLSRRADLDARRPHLQVRRRVPQHRVRVPVPRQQRDHLQQHHRLHRQPADPGGGGTRFADVPAAAVLRDRLRPGLLARDRRLSLELGLRYDFYSVVKEADGRRARSSSKTTPSAPTRTTSTMRTRTTSRRACRRSTS